MFIRILAKIDRDLFCTLGPESDIVVVFGVRTQIDQLGVLISLKADPIVERREFAVSHCVTFRREELVVEDGIIIVAQEVGVAPIGKNCEGLERKGIVNALVPGIIFAEAGNPPIKGTFVARKDFAVDCEAVSATRILEPWVSSCGGALVFSKRSGRTVSHTGEERGNHKTDATTRSLSSLAPGGAISARFSKSGHLI